MFYQLFFITLALYQLFFITLAFYQGMGYKRIKNFKSDQLIHQLISNTDSNEQDIYPSNFHTSSLLFENPEYIIPNQTLKIENIEHEQYEFEKSRFSSVGTNLNNLAIISKSINLNNYMPKCQNIDVPNHVKQLFQSQKINKINTNLNQTLNLMSHNYDHKFYNNRYICFGKKSAKIINFIKYCEKNRIKHLFVETFDNKCSIYYNNISIGSFYDFCNHVKDNVLNEII